MKFWMRFMVGVLPLSGLMMIAQTSQSLSASNAKAKTTAQSAKPNAPNAVQQDPGERKFQANCGRCHTAPEQLPTSITGTVVRHMRVRASLSAQDEQDILRFLAP